MRDSALRGFPRRGRRTALFVRTQVRGCVAKSIPERVPVCSSCEFSARPNRNPFRLERVRSLSASSPPCKPRSAPAPQLCRRIERRRVVATVEGALPAPLWLPLAQLNVTEFAQTLKQWAALVNFKRFSSSPRGHKKPKPKPIYDPKHPHRSTARLLQQQNQYKCSP